MRYVFVNIVGNHFKVWGADTYGNELKNEWTMISYWGRIGIPMCRLQKQNKTFDSFGAIHDYYMKKIEEKLWKGYKGVPNYLYFEWINSSIGIAKLIDVVNKMGELDYYKEPLPKRKTQKKG